MSTPFTRLISRILIVCLIGLPFNVQAGLIGTDEAVSIAQAQIARDKVAQFIDRSDVSNRLQALGLTPGAAKDRVSALTDSEVAQLAKQMDSMPAGANGGGLLLLILIGVLIWWLWK